MSTAKVLVIGSGGREHSLACGLAQSSSVSIVFIAPGNAGTATAGGKISNVSSQALSSPLTDFQGIGDWCVSNDIKLVVVGPEAPLAAGIVDCLRVSHPSLRVFGPSKQAAQIEASKVFSKDFMTRHQIPTAQYRAFQKHQIKEAETYIRTCGFRVVVKASGLAAGKGVIVPLTNDPEEAIRALHVVMADGTFGDAGDECVIEEYLDGEEVSLFCFTDGITIAPLPAAQDHKRLLDGDNGPNTGGMGAYAPAPCMMAGLTAEAIATTLHPLVQGMRKDGSPYIGVVYAGLMVTSNGVKVIEYNCRFGDPECEILIPLLQSDLYMVLMACAEGYHTSSTNDSPLKTLLAKSPLSWFKGSAATVVMASEGYPNSYPKGRCITGLDAAAAMGVKVYHAGTELQTSSSDIVTSGGRVLTVTAVAATLQDAVQRCYSAISVINFQGAQYRKDIGHRALSSRQGLTYKSAGVDVDAGDDLVERIKPYCKATARVGCDGAIGGFGGVFDIKALGMTDPILISGTDGVGTKLRVAQLVGVHDTVGIDLVAMCVNDILVHGAEPLFFLDYYSCGKLDVDIAASVVQGVAKACEESGCALAGGETAEMPGFYPPGEYDMAGFCCGAVERSLMLPRVHAIRDGDIVLACVSSGVHSNGYSLVRKIVSLCGLDYHSPAPYDPTTSLGLSLLTPTRLYVRPLLKAIQCGKIQALAHITGGGLVDNIPRVLPKGAVCELDASNWKLPSVFSWLAAQASVPTVEMARTFNCGIGMILIIHPEDLDTVIAKVPEHLYCVGKINLTLSNAEPVVRMLNIDQWDIAKAQWPSLIPPSNYLQSKKRVAVLISGEGTNMQALIDASLSDSEFGASISLVISNKAGVNGLNRAAKHNIPSVVISHTDYGTGKNHDRVAFDKAIEQVLLKHNIDIICLAGYMRVLSSEFCNRWKNKIINVHPSLLPSFKGYYGTNVHQAVLDAGCRLTGCTVHLVIPDVDAGPILVQEAVIIKSNDTADTLQDRVKLSEHQAFPCALKLLATGKVTINEEKNVAIIQE